MSTPVEQIKERLDIVEVVTGYLKLEPAGANWRARCPFHQEKTPSFFVSPGRQSYHCFGCQKGGDMFSFVQEIEGLDFLGSLKVLADKAGVELTYQRHHQSEDDKKERLIRLLEVATNYYQAQLLQHTGARAYLAERGLSETTINDWRLGFAVDPPAGGWRAVTDYLLAQGFNELELVESGMVSRSTKNDQRIYDRFRGRLMFPLFDVAGRVVGFSGRILNSQTEVAKYLNSPQTLLYDKSRLLYGYHRAKLAIRRADACVLVEGQFDLLLSHQAGVTNTVAVSGTALTEKHFAEPIKRLSRVLIMAFDGDSAGINASRRAVEIALDQGFEVRLVALPTGQDPADLIKADPAAWVERIRGAKHVIDFFLAMIAERNLPPRERAHAVVAEILPLVARLGSQLDQAYFVGQISHLVGLAETVIWTELKKIMASRATGLTKVDQLPGDTTLPVSRRDRITDKLLGLWWWRPEPVGALIQKVWPTEQLQQLATAQQAKKASLLLEAELTYAEYSPAQLQTEVSVLLESWQSESDREAGALVKQKLADSARRGDKAAEEKYLRELQQLSSRLKK